MPGKRASLPRVSSLFRPHSAVTQGLVEAPGTAPGSTTLIPSTVYHHSRRAGRPHIGGFVAGIKGSVRCRSPRRKQAEIAAQRDGSARTRARHRAGAGSHALQRAPGAGPRLRPRHRLHGRRRRRGAGGAGLLRPRHPRTSEDAGLIRYLMRHRHSTPFEMCEIKYHVKLPIFVARQWIRHRMANVNEYSARYSILDREFYIPPRNTWPRRSRSTGRAAATCSRARRRPRCSTCCAPTPTRATTTTPRC